MTSNESVEKSDIKCETHTSYDKTNVTQVDIEEITDKKEERTDYLEDEGPVTKKESPEVQVAHKRSNQSEDTEPVKAANHQPENKMF